MIAASGRGSAAKPHVPKAASPGGGHQRGGATRGEETGVSISWWGYKPLLHQSIT